VLGSVTALRNGTTFSAPRASAPPAAAAPDRAAKAAAVSAAAKAVRRRSISVARRATSRQTPKPR
jgi:hypothetical protein